MRETYQIEGSREIYPLENNLKIQTGFVPDEIFVENHKYSVFTCADAFVQYENGIVMVKRNNLPAKGLWWVMGGKIDRGVPVLEGLRRKVKKESGLELSEIEEIGYERTTFDTDPVGHGCGTDTFNLAHLAIGKGTLKHDSNHSNIMVVTREIYANSEFQKELHPYIRIFSDVVWGKIA